jgi:predicted amidohydrolase YtcJ
VPGLIEGHAHFLGIGRAARILRLAPQRTWEEIVAAVGAAAASAKPGEWILGRGWHQEKWDSPPVPDVEGFPVHDTLSAVSPANPVLLVHASGHAAFANAAALAAAGIDARTPDPPGGEILRDATGRPTGLLREEAENLVRAAYARTLSARSAEENAAETRRALALADREVLSKGITSFHDAGETFEEIEAIARFAESGELGTRLWVMVGDTPERLAAGLAGARRVGAAGGKLTVRAIKAYMDGALGSRGAWLLEPYADQPGSTGLATTPLESLRETARLALAHDYQLCVHAIGDRANRETLDLFAAALATVPDGKARRWRIEHAQHLSPADVPRFAALGVIPAMQGIHCTSDAPFVVERLGERRAREGAYAWRALAAAGARIVNGTDAPVEDVDPIASFHATVTRRLADGTRFFPEQALSREEALATYTVNAAYAAFEETEKGRLAPGMLADVTVLSKDILEVPEEEIRDARALYTIVGGAVVYEAMEVGP